jgi:hypothetical protein
MPVLEQDFLTDGSITNAPPLDGAAERSAFAADLLRHNGRLRLRVHGESMLPALWPGDVVDIASCSMKDVRPGDIVLALREGRFFLHRLAALGTMDGFRLRGDSMPGCDPQFPPEAFLGRLTRIGNEQTSSTWLGVEWCRALGILFCYCTPARRLALKLHARRKARKSRAPEPVSKLHSTEQGIA